RAQQLEPGSVLANTVFGARAVVGVSATIQAAGSFAFIKRELGVPPSTKIVRADSPFDFKSQGLLVLPRAVPDVSHPAYADALAEVCRDVI
ncbi:hypothetical protein ACSLVQ_28270, partial [Klebsiella pneumoniae]|uniref:hypothetical protein n=1 Tax=Klebsiella pneumoniae TaxID=573 RepID=UPI003EE1BD7E